MILKTDNIELGQTKWLTNNRLQNKVEYKAQQKVLNYREQCKKKHKNCVGKKRNLGLKVNYAGADDDGMAKSQLRNSC